ncbi:MAG: hypothetical protein F6K47_36410 [Symploca sp. SIO2E6]|nr:hypothetical protein [Symploca sp. SIO2E6]
MLKSNPALDLSPRLIAQVRFNGLQIHNYDNHYGSILLSTECLIPKIQHVIMEAVAHFDRGIMNFQAIKRFLAGSAVGLVTILILWSYSAFFHVSISFAQGLIGILFLTISCGIIAAMGNFDKLMDNLPFF